ncbi:hypothetical protein DETS111669_18835 [Delftia tsuruhatensis]
MAVIWAPVASDKFITKPEGLTGAAAVRMKMLAVVQFWRTVHRLSTAKSVGEPPTT